MANKKVIDESNLGFLVNSILDIFYDSLQTAIETIDEEVVKIDTKASANDPDNVTLDGTLTAGELAAEGSLVLGAGTANEVEITPQQLSSLLDLISGLKEMSVSDVNNATGKSSIDNS